MYCPLDLYSGEPRRIRVALEALVEGWVTSNGEINNFRLFKSGGLVVPSEVGILFS
jgi:inositol-pentakisphosphate 2-kinase